MKKTIIYVSILVVGLLLSRFIDFSVYSVLAKEENMNYYKETRIHYEYIGFSTYETAKSTLLERKREIKNDIIVISFYDLLHPLRFLVFNKGEKVWIALFPYCNVDFETGLTEISYFKSNRARIKSGGSIRWEYSTVMCSLYHYIFESTYNDNSIPIVVISMYDKFSLRNEPWLKKIYIPYFYIPLILILVFYRKYNIKLAFLYFLIMPLLFFHKHFVFDSIFCNFFDEKFSPSMFNESPIVIQIISIGIFLAFWYLILKNVILGIIDIIKKRNKTDLKEKLIILYFILLPIILRF
jgi:hypothetical protein